MAAAVKGEHRHMAKTRHPQDLIDDLEQLDPDVKAKLNAQQERAALLGVSLVGDSSRADDWAPYARRGEDASGRVERAGLPCLHLGRRDHTEIGQLEPDRFEESSDQLPRRHDRVAAGDHAPQPGAPVPPIRRPQGEEASFPEPEEEKEQEQWQQCERNDAGQQPLGHIEGMHGPPRPQATGSKGHTHIRMPSLGG